MEEDWELLELTGPFTAYSIHAPSSILVYSIGSTIILWDLLDNTKLSIRCHEGPVTSIVFSTDWEYFLTVESGDRPMISVWKWANLSQLTVKRLNDQQGLANAKLGFYGNRIIVIESEVDNGYRLSL